MALEDMNKDDLKDAMHIFAMIRANIENWKYVEANKHLLPRERLEQTIEQMILMFDPITLSAQHSIEVEALTRLDPYDLI